MPNLRNVLWSFCLAGGAVLCAFALHGLIVAVGKRATQRRQGALFEVLVSFACTSTRILLPLLALLLVAPWLHFSVATLSIASHVIGLALIAAVGWQAIKMVGAVEYYVSIHHPAASNSVVSRRLGTQVQVLRHISTVVIAVVTISVMLMTFPNIRHLGESLFASAGLAAVVGGLAARSTLSNLLAGVQIALTQPIRLEDVVIVEGEWGWVEEITTTYVVVRVWDLRRLVLPLSYFIEKPFQNWTRQNADLLGTVFFYTDYSVPVAELREELQRVLQSSGLWDGKVCALQVTNLSERTMELRALMSAPGSSEAWDLRCYVREKLIEFLRERYPQCLPRVRAEVTDLAVRRSLGREDVSAAA